MQNLFTGKRPFYIVVNTSATPGESSTAWAAAEVGGRDEKSGRLGSAVLDVYVDYVRAWKTFEQAPSP